MRREAEHALQLEQHRSRMLEVNNRQLTLRLRAVEEREAEAHYEARRSYGALCEIEVQITDWEETRPRGRGRHNSPPILCAIKQYAHEHQTGHPPAGFVLGDLVARHDAYQQELEEARQVVGGGGEVEGDGEVEDGGEVGLEERMANLAVGGNHGCPICLEECHFQIGCGHHWHPQCLGRWMEQVEGATDRCFCGHLFTAEDYQLVSEAVPQEEEA